MAFSQAVTTKPQHFLTLDPCGLTSGTTQKTVRDSEDLAGMTCSQAGPASSLNLGGLTCSNTSLTHKASYGP